MAKFYTDLLTLRLHVFIRSLWHMQYYSICDSRTAGKWFNFTVISLRTPAIQYQNKCNTHMSPICVGMK